MRTVKFNIKKLGAVKDSSIELAPLMVFSGESGLGKSYVAFLVHYVYMLLTDNRLEKFFRDNNYDLNILLENKKAKDVILTIATTDLLSWINLDAIEYIGYLLGHSTFAGDIEIGIPIQDESLEFRFDEEIFGLDNNEEVFYKIRLKKFEYRIPSSTKHFGLQPLVELVQAVFSDVIFENYLFLKRTFLMPPSRGSLVELNSRPAFSSGMYEEFFDNKETLDRPLKEAPKDISEKLLQCLVEINVGDIQQAEGKMIYYTNGTEMPVTAAASSIKELTPLTMFFKKYPASGASILFEEPEAHLHPARQAKVADLIGCAIQLGCHLQITTHSDYFIKRLNILIQLFKLKSKDINKYREFQGFKDECLINPDDVNAYVLKKTDEGFTKIEKQEIGEEGIPFDSFYDTIIEDITTSQNLKKAREE